MPSSTIAFDTPFHKLFNHYPYYTSLRVFGCPCYPWLRPYTNHKLEPCSHPCVFLGYSIAHHSFYCFDPQTNKVFVSRHVNFVEHVFPYHNLDSSVSCVTPTTPTEFYHLIAGPLQPQSTVSKPNPPSPTSLSATTSSNVILFSSHLPHSLSTSTAFHSHSSTSPNNSASLSPSPALADSTSFYPIVPNSPSLSVPLVAPISTSSPPPDAHATLPP